LEDGKDFLNIITFRRWSLLGAGGEFVGIIIAASSELVRWAQDCTVRSKMSIATTRTPEVPFFFVFPFIKSDL